MTNEQRLTYEFIKVYPEGGARILERLKSKDVASFLMEAPPKLSASVFGFMDPLTASHCLEHIGPKRSTKIIENISLENAAILLRRMGEGFRNSLLESISPTRSEPLHRVLKFPEETAGALMDPLVPTVPNDLSIGEVLRHIQKSRNKEFEVLFVVDRNHQLAGWLGMERIVLAPRKILVSSMVKKFERTLSPYTKLKAILANPGWQDIRFLPVVDDKGILLGAISLKTLRGLINSNDKSIASASNADPGKALGELYGIGISAFLKAATSALSEQ